MNGFVVAPSGKLNISPTTKKLVWACGAAALLLLALVTVFVVQPTETLRLRVAAWSAPTVGVLATVAMVWGAWRTRQATPKLGQTWSLFSVSQSLLVLGVIVTLGDAAYPSRVFPHLGDYFYGGAILALFVAMARFPAAPLKREEWVKTSIESAIIAVAAGLLYWNLLIGPQIPTGHPLTVTAWLALSLPVAGLLLLWAMHALLYRQLPAQPRLSLRCGVLFIIIVNILASRASSGLADGWYTIDSLTLIFWPIAFVVSGLTGLTQGILITEGRDVETETPSPSKRTLRNWVPYTWVAAASALMTLSDRLPMDDQTLGWCVAGLVGLVIVRQQVSFIENARLAKQLQRELELRRRAQAELEAVNAELENRVQERMRELTHANSELRQEMAERARVEATLREREEKLLHHALHDALTGLPNRTLFAERLERAIERARRHDDYRFAVLFLDVDGFKVVNDSLGHRIGDELLIEIARRLQTALRALDTVARLGGDEFVILLDGIGVEADAQLAAERLQQTLVSAFNVSGHRVFVSASIGIVMGGTGYVEPADILRDADLAMYQAKFLGKARHAIFTLDMRTQALTRLILETELRSALEQRQLSLYYQPILALSENRITGFEALLRWRHPERGFIPPADFIPIAEATGLILPIGKWVLEEACRQMAAWQAQYAVQPPLSVSVNLSARQFAQHDLPEQIERMLAQAGLPAQCLKLEITESAIIDDTEAAVRMLERLRGLGVQVQMDDFGTGYSSLSYLHRFPIDTLKIDRSFVNRMTAQGDHTEIVRTITVLARDLEMKVIAEGVETAAQLAVLRQLNCEYGQGYFISKPLEPQAIETLITERLLTRQLA